MQQYPYPQQLPGNPYYQTLLQQQYQLAQQQQQQLMQGQQPYNGITKVNSQESAMQVNLPPTSTSDPMFNIDGRHFYVVSTDGTGSKTLERFRYEKDDEPLPADGAQYVTRQEFDAFVAKLIGGAGNGTDGSAQAAAAAE